LEDLVVLGDVVVIILIEWIELRVDKEKDRRVIDDDYDEGKEIS